MSWESILKIKTSSGEYLKLKDWDAFVERLRTLFNSTAAPYFSRGSTDDYVRESVPRKSYVRMKQTQPHENRLVLDISIRNPIHLTRDFYEITFMEDNEGDYIFLTAFGRHLDLAGNDVVNSESELLMQIAQSVTKYYDEVVVKPTRLSVTEPERKTEAQIKAELEEANPGFEYIKGRMVDKRTLQTFNQNPQGMTLGDILGQYGYTVEDLTGGN